MTGGANSRRTRTGSTPARTSPSRTSSTPGGTGPDSSACRRGLERLDAESSETDDQGRPHTYGKVAAVAAVGSEDGAHKVNADVFQGLNDAGFSPADGPTAGRRVSPGAGCGPRAGPRR